MFSLEISTQLRFQLFILLVKCGGLEGTCSRSWYYQLGRGKQQGLKNYLICSHRIYVVIPGEVIS